MCSTRQRKPLKPVVVECRWVRRLFHNTVDHKSGCFELNGAFYGVFLTDAGGYRLSKAFSEDVYDIDPTPAYGWQCDCPDATFQPERPGGCKHVAALRQLLSLPVEG